MRVAQGDGPGALAAYRAAEDPRSAGAAGSGQHGVAARSSVSHNKVGDVLVAQGDGPGALAAYRAGLKIREALAQQDPANTQWQVDVAISCWKIGSIEGLLSINDRKLYLLRGRQILAALKEAGRLQPTQDWIGSFDAAIHDLDEEPA